MKPKSALAITAALLLTLIAAAPVFALGTQTAPRVSVNGSAVVFPDARPFADENGRLFVPVKFVAEALGATVEWDAATQTVTVTRGRISASITAGETDMKILGVGKKLDAPPIILEGRTFVPLSFISTVFGSEVSWSVSTGAAIITDSGEDVYKIGDFSIVIAEEDMLALAPEGFLTITTPSGLIITEGLERGKNPIFILQITVDNPDADLPAQCEEAGELLKQCLSATITKEIVDHVISKAVSKSGYEFTEYGEGIYNIYVFSGLGPITVMVYTN